MSINNLEISIFCEIHILLSIPCKWATTIRGFYLRLLSPPTPLKTPIFGRMAVKVYNAPPSVV